MRTYEIRLPELPYKCEYCGRPSETPLCGVCAIGWLMPIEAHKKMLAKKRKYAREDAAKQNI